MYLNDMGSFWSHPFQVITHAITNPIKTVTHATTKAVKQTANIPLHLLKMSPMMVPTGHNLKKFVTNVSRVTPVPRHVMTTAGAIARKWGPRPIRGRDLHHAWGILRQYSGAGIPRSFLQPITGSAGTSYPPIPEIPAAPSVNTLPSTPALKPVSSLPIQVQQAIKKYGVNQYMAWLRG